MPDISADTVIQHGNVITMDPARPRAQALAVKFGRILAVGTDDDIGPLAGKSTRVINTSGQTVIPGLNDAHCHVLPAGRSHLMVDCGPAAVSSIAEIKDLVAERMRQTPSGDWVVGFGYDDTKMAEDWFLNRHDLDEVAPEHPVLVRHVGGHMSTVNSAGLKLAGINRDSADPVGGRYGHDPVTGEPDGVIYETAQRQFARGPRPLIPPSTPEQDREAIRWVCRQAASLGLTSFTDASVDPPGFQAYQDALASGDLSLRTYMLLSVDFLDSFISSGLRTGLGNEMLRVGAIKIVGDGAIAGRTAYLSEPYEGTTDDFGILAIDPEVLEERVMAAHRAGFQVAVHANGDRIINMTLDAYEKALRAYPREDHRHRLEHGTIVNPAILARMKSLGVAVLPFGSYIYYHAEKMRFYGQKRLAMMFAHRSFLDNGIIVGGSSDHQCAPWPPLAGIQSCVTRKGHTGELLGTEQRVTPEEALRIYTMGSAQTSFEEKIKGSIEAGKLADIVFLGADPTQVDPETIKDITVMATMVGGEFVYQT